MLDLTTGLLLHDQERIVARPGGAVPVPRAQTLVAEMKDERVTYS
ncbi:MAG: hypothetical protein V3U27_14080 [Candidatus Tectomicrobia bacterium]